MQADDSPKGFDNKMALQIDGNNFMSKVATFLFSNHPNLPEQVVLFLFFKSDELILKTLTWLRKFIVL